MRIELVACYLCPEVVDSDNVTNGQKNDGNVYTRKDKDMDPLSRPYVKAVKAPLKICMSIIADATSTVQFLLEAEARVQFLLHRYENDLCRTIDRKAVTVKLSSRISMQMCGSTKSYARKKMFIHGP